MELGGTEDSEEYYRWALLVLGKILDAYHLNVGSKHPGTKSGVLSAWKLRGTKEFKGYLGRTLAIPEEALVVGHRGEAIAPNARRAFAAA